MNANDLFTFITGGFFILLGVLTAADFVRHRGEIRRDVALMVWSIALIFLIQVAVRIAGITSPRWLTLIGTVGLLAQPYLLLRIVRYFHRTPARLMRGALIGMVASWVAAVVFTPAPTIINLLIIAYFAVINGYAMVAFVRGAVRTTGVVRQRLRFAAAGTGLFALLLILAGLGSIIPALQGLTGLLAIAALVGCGIAYYVGFAPPRWLRRSWQFNELNRYLTYVSSKPTDERLNLADSMTALSHAASQGVGGMAAGIVQRDESDQRWVLRYEVSELGQFPSADADIFTQTWQDNTPRFARMSAGVSAGDRRLLKSLGADTVIVVPIHTRETTWGLLVVFLQYGSLFIDDDLNLVTLLVKQSAIFLENNMLLEQLRGYADTLVQKVEERTEELRETEGRYQHTLDNMMEGCQILDFDWHYLYINDSGARYGRMSKEELLGHTLMEKYPGIETTEMFAVMQQCMKERTVRLQQFEFTYADGSQSWFEFSIQPVPEGIFVLSLDITDRKHAEEELARYQEHLEDLVEQRTKQLRQSEEKFSKAFQASPAAISIGTLPDGRWIEINEALARMTGYSSEELLGHTSAELGLVDDAARVKILEALRTHGAVRNVEIQMHNKSNEVVELLVSVEQIEINGQPCALTIQYDITELKRAEREVRRLNEDLERRQVALEATNRELEAFTYSVSHDLRAPLRAIDGFSQALEEELPDGLSAAGKRYVERIRGASQRMGQLIDDLLDLSRITRSDMQREQINLSEIARQVAAELREQYPEHDVAFDVKDGLVINGDVRLMRVVMSNLLSNAWKYTGKQSKPQVEFGVAEQNGRTTYFVRDNGAGFDMTYSDKLFGVFQRLHGANEFPGNGIGLATVQRIIYRHGGDIWADAAVGKGATFYFSL